MGVGLTADPDFQPEHIGRCFDELADRHDAAVGGGLSGAVDAWTTARLKELARDSAGPALILGSGSGREAEPFLDRGRGVVLVDVSARMVELATTRLVPHPESRIVCQDVGRFLADERTVYATVTAVGELLAHLPDPQSFLCRVAALMPPGGLFLMSFMDAAAMRTWEGTRVAAEVGTSSLLLEERCDLDAGSLHCRADEGRFVESWALRAGLTALRRSPAGHTRSGRLFRRT